MLNNSVSFMAMVVCATMAFLIIKALIRGYKRKIGFPRLAIVAGVGAIFIGSIYMMWIA